MLMVFVQHMEMIVRGQNDPTWCYEGSNGSIVREKRLEWLCTICISNHHGYSKQFRDCSFEWLQLQHMEDNNSSLFIKRYINIQKRYTG